MTLLIGSGRTATHFKNYFQLLKVPFQTWNRRDNSKKELQNMLPEAKRIWVLISDGALKSFIRDELFEAAGPIFHSSGALEIPGAIGLHPLMTFSSSCPSLEPLEFYTSIPFVLTNSKKLQDYFPELSNPSFHIRPESKAKYHALCVLSGNFTTLLWQQAFRGFADMGLPRQVAEPYLSKIVANILQNPGEALTGPLARKDRNTIESNLSSLEGDPLQDIYQSFVRNYFPEYPI
jgi:2-dehydropantoate 2-reductase